MPVKKIAYARLDNDQGALKKLFNKRKIAKEVFKEIAKKVIDDVCERWQAGDTNDKIESLVDDMINEELKTRQLI